MRKPILGVCYGVQSLNVWRSGTLIQHIESEVLHQRPEGAPAGTVISHDAVVPRKSRLGEILAAHVAEVSGELKFTVNSYHHQSVGRPGDGLRIVALTSPDPIAGLAFFELRACLRKLTDAKPRLHRLAALKERLGAKTSGSGPSSPATQEGSNDQA